MEQLETSRYIILKSGNVIVPWGEYVQIPIKSLNVRFSFEDGVGFVPSFESNVGSDNRGRFFNVVMKNIKRACHITNSEMIRIGMINKKPLLLMFSVLSINVKEFTEDRMIFYTFYLEK